MQSERTKKNLTSWQPADDKESQRQAVMMMKHWWWWSDNEGWRTLENKEKDKDGCVSLELAEIEKNKGIESIKVPPLCYLKTYTGSLSEGKKRRKCKLRQ